MQDAFRSHIVILGLIPMVLVAPEPAKSQIVTDGSLGGPKVSLRGGQIEIGADLGTRRGDNLFHSFERFGLAPGQTATFTGPDTLRNVISRVTGGQASHLDGTLRSTVGQADFYFINPAGLVFGPNARIDVPAAFYVSTADELRFADGATFNATDPAASRLTVAVPEAFGFLRPTPAGIAVNASRLETQPGQTLAVAGGDLRVSGGTLVSPGGQVHLTAMAGPGTVPAAGGAAAGAARGAVQLAHGARVDTSGNGGGRIVIRGGQFMVTGSSVSTDNTGPQDATGGIDIAGDTVRVTDNSTIGTSTRERGKAGTVRVTGRDIEVRNGSWIASNTFAQGDAGTVTVDATDRLFISRDGAQSFTGIFSLASSTGAAGTVQVTAGDLQLRNGSWIASNTFAQGDAGTVTVDATDRLFISRDGAQSFTGIFSQAFSTGAASTGAAGTVQVTAGDLQLLNGGQISSDTFSQGNAGTVDVQADRLLVSGDGSEAFTGIFSEAKAKSTGSAGQVSVTAGELQIRGGGQISSSTYGHGNAEQVTVQADRLTVDGEGRSPPFYSGIFSDAVTGSGNQAGRVEVTAGELALLNGGYISSDTYAGGKAGEVNVTADHLLISGTSNDGQLFSGISSQSVGHATGKAGDVKVHAGELQVRDGGEISTSTEGTGFGGAVTVETGTLEISGGYVDARSQSSATDAGPGGTVHITARDLQVRNSGAITTSSMGGNVAGDIMIEAADAMRLETGTISTQAAAADGGRMTIRVGNLINLQDSKIITSVAGFAGNGGNITIDPRFLILDSNSRIAAQARGGNGGNIFIDAGTLIQSPGSVIDATSELGISGTVNLTAPNVDVVSSLVMLPKTFLDASSLLRESCARQGGRPTSSLVMGGRGGLPPDPDARLSASPLDSSNERRADQVPPSSMAMAPLPSLTKGTLIAGNPVLGAPRISCRS